MAGLFDRVARVVSHPIGLFSISPWGCNINHTAHSAHFVLDCLHLSRLAYLWVYSRCICSLFLVPRGSLLFSIFSLVSCCPIHFLSSVFLTVMWSIPSIRLTSFGKGIVNAVFLLVGCSLSYLFHFLVIHFVSFVAAILSFFPC